MILVDEPTADLDTENAKIIVDYLVRTGKSHGKTVVMATHDPRVARAGDRILRIGDGVIVEDVKSIESLHGVEAYESFIRMRAAEVKRDMVSLESEFKSGQVSTDTFAQRHRVLLDNIEVLEAEIQRLGSLMTK
jgi:putative ABC transport system ATP-binding protein